MEYLKFIIIHHYKFIYCYLQLQPQIYILGNYVI